MRCKYDIVLILSILSCLYCKQSFFSSCIAQTLDFPARLKQGQQLVDRNQDRLVSENGGFFKLGFLSPGTSSASGATSNRYLGLFYTKLPSHPDAVWVANPKTPISDSSGVFTLDSDGKLKIMYSGGQISVSDTNQTDSGNVTATLLGTGNLVLQEIASNGAFGSVLWESFDHPTNTLLPGMKLGMNFKTGQKWTLFSWLSDQVPAPGAFSLGVDPGGADQLIIWRRGDVYWKSGVWVNDSFQGSPELTKRVDLFEFTFVSNKEEKYFSYSVKNSSIFSRWELNLQGQILHSVLNPNWTIWESTVTGPCEFNENYPDAMCIEEKISKCRNGSELFVPIRGYFNETKFLYADDDTSLAISDCHAACWRNCTCVGYQSLYTNNGTGCVYMIEGAKFEESDYFGFTYILTIGRNSSKDGTPTEEGKKIGSAGSVAKKWWIWSVISITLSVTVLLLGFLRYIRKIKRRFMQHTSQEQGLNELRSQITRIGNVHRLKLGKSIGQEFQMFSFSGIVAATNNFSSASKLGEGGFGPVYKGVLPDGQQVAVKRLARNSGQGLEEFRNEITLIAELQHRNLVRIFGCCIQGEEKILIYEYLRNASLDAFLFDPTKGKHLDWQQRVNIIEGIVQGLLYLHKYSRVRIIHRDLKASNILLDGNMNPKISDFGMARIFEQNESTSKTKRVVGTYGYMSPEYAMKGIFSDKSDVYSFGVLLLEIVSGKKNTVFVSSTSLSLVELAWDLWKQGDTQELKDASLDSCPEDEVLKFFHLSLLCVQEYAADRPTMAEVVSMLTSDSMFFPDPKQPAYHISRSEVASSRPDGRRPDMGSADYVPITVMEAR
ncbi:G-type lectin S-receptor-like serine/threonine-protein kinase CES101 [Pyrus communis]|uniref:G-type lectin S-receptor-like serine/threonine-protein kinase CES101 n=1 Tax=Pyrus communis TaxID=23211 RepID=UPI0035BFB4F2